jgi:hypothetical protein
MKKTRVPEPSDPADHEVNFRGAIRGKYADLVAQGEITVRLAPDVARVFPDSQAVNDALRRLIRESSPRSRDRS